MPLVVLELVDAHHGASLSAFLKLGRDYLREVLPGRGAEDHAAFLQSMLDRQGEPDRWLHLFRIGDDYVGVAHTKIDQNDRPGWGYILEFYVEPLQRRRGVGAAMCGALFGLLRERGVDDVWLASHPLAEGFWQSVGFGFDGEMEGDQRVMVARIA